ncbi:MAG: putative zinc-binding protein [Firmicutes bacterium]|nr:putative zinc-binding protein [Bacillota bacterium]
MSEAQNIKVGIISCSGEEISEGTLARNSVRIALEKFRPGKTVTICLPLFLAGDGGERAFAKKFPTITVDGCGKLCAYKATEKYSSKPNGCIDIREILKELGESAPASKRNYTEKDWALAEKIAAIIADRVDMIFEQAETGEKDDALNSSAPPVCSCMSGSPKTDMLMIGNVNTEVTLLDMIIDLTASKAIPSDEERADFLLKQAKIYNGSLLSLPDEDIKTALMKEYGKRKSST